MLQSPSSATTDRELSDFETALRHEGYRLNLPPEEAKELMKDNFSSASLQRFEALMALRVHRPYGADELYSVVETLDEAALLLSPQAHITSACGQQLYRKLKEILTPGMSVADMGCGVGSWTRWMAQHFTNNTFTGFDRHDGLMDIAMSASKFDNCQYSLAEYTDLSPAYGSFDIISSLLGIDFDPGQLPKQREVLHALDATLHPICGYFRNLAASAFGGWKRVMRPDGVIMVTLRLPSFESWYGCLMGARDVGLCFNAEASSCVAVGKQRFPLLVLQHAESMEALNLDELLTWWVDRTGASAEAQVLVDTAALWRYRKLKDRQILDQSETQYDDGHILIKETGLAAGVGYVYEYATTLYRRLECIPKERLKEVNNPTYSIE